MEFAWKTTPRAILRPRDADIIVGEEEDGTDHAWNVEQTLDGNPNRGGRIDRRDSGDEPWVCREFPRQRPNLCHTGERRVRRPHRVGLSGVCAASNSDLAPHDGSEGASAPRSVRSGGVGCSFSPSSASSNEGRARSELSRPIARRSARTFQSVASLIRSRGDVNFLSPESPRRAGVLPPLAAYRLAKR